MDTNLRARVLAAAVLIPVAVGAVLLLPTPWFAGFLALFVLAAGWEWSALAGWRDSARRIGYAASMLLGLWLAWIYPSWGAAALWVGLAYWLVCCVLVVAVQSGRAMQFLDAVAVKATAGWLTLIPAWWGLVFVHSNHSNGPALVMLVLGLVWFADIGAYFSGRRFGRRKLASRISPGKTWEGATGALFAVAVLAVLFWLIQTTPGAFFGEFFALCMAVGVISIVGDLMESLFKRRAGVKDSGGLIPGHGGVLDRLDSITAAAPCFALGLCALEVFR